MNAFTAALKLIDPFVIALTGLFSYYLRFDDLELRFHDRGRVDRAAHDRARRQPAAARLVPRERRLVDK